MRGVLFVIWQAIKFIFGSKVAWTILLSILGIAAVIWIADRIIENNQEEKALRNRNEQDNQVQNT